MTFHFLFFCLVIHVTVISLTDQVYFVVPGIEHMAFHMLGMYFATALLIAKLSPFSPYFYYIMHMCLSVCSMCVCVHVPVATEARGGCQISLELQLQAVMSCPTWVLRAEFGSPT